MFEHIQVTEDENDENPVSQCMNGLWLVEGNPHPPMLAGEIWSRLSTTQKITKGKWRGKVFLQQRK
uniref:Uncharacterized protein n=1 Tax=Peromyscus maniculatus bairdii TaxID=230844 RepID=A0A8C8W685_PERMB